MNRECAGCVYDAQGRARLYGGEWTAHIDAVRTLNHGLESDPTMRVRIAIVSLTFIGLGFAVLLLALRLTGVL